MGLANVYQADFAYIDGRRVTVQTDTYLEAFTGRIIHIPGAPSQYANMQARLIDDTSRRKA